MAPRKALPRRPARGASPRAARPALPAAAPAGAKRNQWVQGERTTPRALGAVAKSHWLGTPGGCGLGHGGRGHQGGSRQRLCFSGPPARRREGAVQWALCALEPGTSQLRCARGGARSASTLGPLTVFGCDSAAQPHRPCQCPGGTVANTRGTLGLSKACGIGRS